MRDAKARIRAAAKELGFQRMYVTGMDALPDLSQDASTVHPAALRLLRNPREAEAWASSVVLLVWPFRPYAKGGADAQLSAYYVASNEAHRASRELAATVAEMGIRASANARIPMKPLAERAGIGRYGRNGLIAADGLGSWIVLSALLIEAEVEADPPAYAPGLSPECENCSVCQMVCPTGAIRGDSSIEISRCLRARMDDLLIAESFRQHITSVLGCDICQSCCPRNAGIPDIEMPSKLAEALKFQRLLAGEVQPLEGWIGVNYAKKARLTARACLAAGNAQREDCLPALVALTGAGETAVAECAEWAIRRIGVSAEGD